MVDRVVLADDISRGERIREFQIDALVNGEWSTVARGTAVGHKRIVRLEPIRAESVRVRVLKSVGEPILRKFSLHRAGVDAATEPPK